MGTIISFAISLTNAFVSIFTPLLLLGCIILLVYQAFERDLLSAIRSLAGALIPFISFTFLNVSFENSFVVMSQVHIILSFLFSLIWGMGVMYLLKIFAKSNYRGSPITEFLLSASFSLLVFGYLKRVEGGSILAYFYGMAIGFLIYVFVFGVPQVFNIAEVSSVTSSANLVIAKLRWDSKKNRLFNGNLLLDTSCHSSYVYFTAHSSGYPTEKFGSIGIGRSVIYTRLS